MIRSAEHRAAAIHYVPGRLGILGAAAASTAGWLLVIGGLVEMILVLPELHWTRTTYVVMLWGSPQIAIWTTGRLIAFRRIRARVPAAVLEQRYHGSLGAITDSERRPLRSIGATAVEVAERTSVLLDELVAIPSVRIFRSVRSADATLPLVTHAVSAGRMLLLVESVAWPPGQYRTGADGRVHCDGLYIGQSISPLTAAVRHWQSILPRRHRVSALVIVHRSAGGEYELPAAPPQNLSWTLAGDAIRDIQDRIPSRRPAVSRQMLATLVAATADQPL